MAGFRNSSTAQVLQPLEVIDGERSRLLTVRQVAERLGVSRATVYKLVASGELPHRRVGNAIRVRTRDVEKLIDGESYGL